MNKVQAEHILNSCKLKNIIEMYINQITELKTLSEYLYPNVYFFPKVCIISEWIYNLSLPKGKKLLLVIGNVYMDMLVLHHRKFH